MRCSVENPISRHPPIHKPARKPALPLIARPGRPLNFRFPRHGRPLAARTDHSTTYLKTGSSRGGKEINTSQKNCHKGSASKLLRAASPPPMLFAPITPPIAHPLSLIPYLLSLIAYPLSLIPYRLSLIAYPLSLIPYRLSLIAYPLSLIARRASTTSLWEALLPFGKYSQNPQPLLRQRLTSISLPASHPKNQRREAPTMS